MIIRTEGLSKSYGTFKAVDELSLEADQGEIYGFLGLNGAGKTTTIRMLLGMISRLRWSLLRSLPPRDLVIIFHGLSRGCTVGWRGNIRTS
ncbi:MAG: ATP-binding cassette domain-containing protein [Cyclobacteriaceae bacterium]